MIKTEIFKSHFIKSGKASSRLMIVLHGKGDSLQPFRYFNEELGLSSMNFLLINAPKKFLGGYSWYKEPPNMKNDILQVRKMVTELLYDLIEQGWKAENIFLFGFSQGCLISADVALHFPHKLAGVIGVSGYFYFFPRWRTQLKAPNKKTPWLLTHGTKDEILPLAVTKFGVDKLKQVGIDIDWIELEKKHVLKNEEYPLIRKWVNEKTQKLSKF